MVLSGVILARDEELRIAGCIQSLSFCDEILVVDNGSTDKTASIARDNGVKIISTKGDFSKLRNTAMQEAKGKWILYVDSDETVSPQLAREIIDAVQKNSLCSYTVRRVNYYLGKRWPKEEQMLRLFEKSALEGWVGSVHETAQVSGTTGHLSGELTHNTHRNLSEMAVKTNEWSAIEARLRFDTGHPPVVWWRILRVMWTGFFDSYIRQRGYTVGIVGLIESMFQAYSMFVTYAKLWELQQNKSKT